MRGILVIVDSVYVDVVVLFFLISVMMLFLKIVVVEINEFVNIVYF